MDTLEAEETIMDWFADPAGAGVGWGDKGETLRVFAGPMSALLHIHMEVSWGQRCGVISRIERDTGYVTVTWHEEFWHVEHDEGHERRYRCRDSMEGLVSRELDPLIAAPVASKEKN